MPVQQQNFLNDEPDQQDIIGVIKIKDGIFICDEFGAQVTSLAYQLGP